MARQKTPPDRQCLTLLSFAGIRRPAAAREKILATRLLIQPTMRETFTKLDLTDFIGRKSVLSFVTALVMVWGGSSRAAQSVALAWSPSTAGNVAGYMIHYGNSPANYNKAVDAGLSTVVSVAGLTEGETNYFQVAAYDTNHVESPPSNLAVYYVPGVMTVHPRTEARQAATVNFPVAPGHTYKVQATTDFKNWETVWQTTATANTWVQFEDPAAANLTMRFYRTVSN
jgi:hypothetical protein